MVVKLRTMASGPVPRVRLGGFEPLTRLSWRILDHEIPSFVHEITSHPLYFLDAGPSLAALSVIQDGDEELYDSWLKEAMRIGEAAALASLIEYNRKNRPKLDDALWKNQLELLTTSDPDLANLARAFVSISEILHSSRKSPKLWLALRLSAHRTWLRELQHLAFHRKQLPLAEELGQLLFSAFWGGEKLRAVEIIEAIERPDGIRWARLDRVYGLTKFHEVGCFGLVIQIAGKLLSSESLSEPENWALTNAVASYLLGRGRIILAVPYAVRGLVERVEIYEVDLNRVMFLARRMKDIDKIPKISVDSMAADTRQISHYLRAQVYKEARSLSQDLGGDDLLPRALANVLHQAARSFLKWEAGTPNERGVLRAFAILNSLSENSNGQLRDFKPSMHILAEERSLHRLAELFKLWMTRNPLEAIQVGPFYYSLREEISESLALLNSFLAERVGEAVRPLLFSWADPKVNSQLLSHLERNYLSWEDFWPSLTFSTRKTIYQGEVVPSHSPPLGKEDRKKIVPPDRHPLDPARTIDYSCALDVRSVDEEYVYVGHYLTAHPCPCRRPKHELVQQVLFTTSAKSGVSMPFDLLITCCRRCDRRHEFLFDIGSFFANSDRPSPRGEYDLEMNFLLQTLLSLRGWPHGSLDHFRQSRRLTRKWFSQSDVSTSVNRPVMRDMAVLEDQARIIARYSPSKAS